MDHQDQYQWNQDENANEFNAIEMIMDELKSLHEKQDKVYLTSIPTSLTLCLILFCVDT